MQKIINLKNSLKGRGLRSLSADTFWTILSQASITLMNIGIVFFLANLLSPNDYGQYKMVSTWLAIAISLGYTGYIYTLPQKYARKEFVDLKDLLKKTLVKSSHVIITLFLICIYYFYNQNLNLGVSFFLTAILAPVTLLSMLANTYYNGTKNFKLSAISLNLIQLFQFISVTLTAYLSQDFLHTISAFLISTIIANTASILFILYKSKSYISTNEINIDENLAEESGANKLNFTSIFSGLALQLDKLLLFHFVGAAELSIYTISLAISDQARAPFKSIASVLLPRMSETHTSKKKIFLLFFALTVFSGLCSVILMLLNPLIFKTFFPKYLEFVYLANIASCFLVFSSGALLSTYIQSKKDFETLNTVNKILIYSQPILYTFAAFLKSVLYMIVFRNLIGVGILFYMIFVIQRASPSK